MHLQYPSSRSRYSVVQFRFIILGIHATAHRLSSASILSYLRSSLQPVSFTDIALPRVMLSPCHYRYPPRSTELMPLVPLRLSYRPRHSIAVALKSVRCRRCHLSLSQVILSLSSGRCLSLSSSSSIFTSRITASKPRRSSALREGILS
jgi:hypothetical protein